MNQNIKISIIVPIYNSERYLRKCIDSVLQQTYKNIELLLVDDFSQDHSPQIIEYFLHRDCRVKSVRLKKNSGQVSAYIEGIKKASGDYIGFVDSDDYIDCTMYDELVRGLQYSLDVDIVACGCWHVYGGKKVIEPSNIAELGQLIMDNNQIRQYLHELRREENPVNEILKLYRWNKIYRKKIVLDNIKYFDREIKVFEDNNFVVPCLLDANKVVYINKPLYYYRRLKSSTMTLIGIDILLSNRRFIKDQEKIYKDKEMEHDIRQDILLVVVYSLVRIIKMKDSIINKKSLLYYLTEDIKKLDISYSFIKQYGYSKKIFFLLHLLKYKYYSFILVIGELFNKYGK